MSAGQPPVSGREAAGLESRSSAIPKVAPPQYLDLLARLRSELGPRRNGLLIGLDGLNMAGKSSLASWLAWQLEMPSVHLDLYLVSDEPVSWREADLARAIGARLDGGRPVIVEGMMLLDALERIGRTPNFLVFVEQEGNEGSHVLGLQIKPYVRRRQSRDKADHVLVWSTHASERDPGEQ